MDVYEKVKKNGGMRIGDIIVFLRDAYLAKGNYIVIDIETCKYRVSYQPPCKICTGKIVIAGNRRGYCLGRSNTPYFEFDDIVVNNVYRLFDKLIEEVE